MSDSRCFEVESVGFLIDLNLEYGPQKYKGLP